MNVLTKVIRSQVPTMKHIPSSIACAKNLAGKREFNRTISFMCRSENTDKTRTPSSLGLFKYNFGCSGLKQVHTKGERELVEFLTKKIVAEKKAQKQKTLPTEVDGFKVKLNGGEVELTKQLTDKEKIVISFNVNHTVNARVDGEVEAEADPSADKPNVDRMRSRPQFKIDIVKGSQTLSFTCSFFWIFEEEAQEGERNVIGIDEITVYEGEWTKAVYAVYGDVFEDNLYDLLMNYLKEKGISNAFAEKLSDFSTAYERSAYTSFLERISRFAIEKK